jgi:hypothetical protein
MRVSILRCCLVWMLLVMVPASLLGQTQPVQTQPVQTQPVQSEAAQQGQTDVAAAGHGQAEQGDTGGAILHTQGEVWVNGYEAKDSSAVFPGDLIETKPDSPASLSLDGSTVLIQPESVARLQANVLDLDHGSLSVGTSKSFKVKARCVTVVPVGNEWTQYEVTDLNGNMQVAARKNDVKVEPELNPRKPAPTTEDSHGTLVHEGEQKSFNETELCGAPPRPKLASPLVNPKWIAAGAAGTGILLCVLFCSGPSSKPVSPTNP